MTKKKSKLDKPAVYKCFYRWVTGQTFNGLPRMIYDFEHVLRVYETDTKGIFQLVELLDNNTCADYSEQQLSNEILKASYEFVNEFCLDVSQSNSCAKAIINSLATEKISGLYTKLIPKPECVVFKSDERLAYNRLDFDPAEGPCPNWEEIISRCSNPVALEAFIGALFDNSMSRTQYLYIKGKGNTGKSTIANFIRYLMKDSMITATTKNVESDWFFSQIVNARLCYITEASPVWPLSNEFKSLTGDDKIIVNIKYRNPFAATISTRFMFVSNDALKMDDLIENKRRALYTELEPFAGEEKTEKKALQDLIDEAPAILHRCLATLEKHRKGDKIQTSADALRDLISENQMWIENFIDDYFTLSPDSFISVADFQRAVRHSKLSFIEQKNLKGFLENNGVDLKATRWVKPAGYGERKKQRGYKGITWNPRAPGYLKLFSPIPLQQKGPEEIEF